MFALTRDEVNPFTEKQIELVTTFADQASSQSRTRGYSRRNSASALESSPSRWNSKPPRQRCSMSSAARRSILTRCLTPWSRARSGCAESDRAIFYRFDGGLLRMARVSLIPGNSLSLWKKLRSILAEAVPPLVPLSNAERFTLHDCMADPEYSWGGKYVDPVRTVLAVPQYKGDDLLGMIVVYHLEVRPFAEKQIELAETFADQAAIAIENAQLLNELRQRTNELGRSVEEQRALGEVSQAVNSTLELETVLSTIVAKAVQLRHRGRRDLCVR